jgi:hypothetical protein
MFSLRLCRRQVLLLFLIGLAPVTTPLHAAASLEHQAIKIQLGAPYAGSASIHLCAARNEYESFQVVLDGPMAGVVAPSASALTGPAGTLPSTSMRFSRVGYLNITTTSNDEGMTGLVPDALIPDVDLYYGETRNAFPIDVPAGENRLIWVDLFVPEATPAGDYQGAP